MRLWWHLRHLLLRAGPGVALDKLAAMLRHERRHRHAQDDYGCRRQRHTPPAQEFPGGMRTGAYRAMRGREYRFVDRRWRLGALGRAVALGKLRVLRVVPHIRLAAHWESPMPCRSFASA
jgi:hypothetical protein